MAHGSADSFVPGGTGQRRHWQSLIVERAEASWFLLQQAVAIPRKL
jgi:hypothetical protein